MIKVPEAQNDLKQLKQCRGILASVYSSQVTDKLADNGNLTELNTAVLCINNVIIWLENKKDKE